MDGAAPAGWHPDPANPSSGALRYWDGNKWTDQVRPGTAEAPPFPPPATGYPAFGSQPYGQQPYAPWGGGRNQSFGSANRFSFIAVGVSILYLVIAVTTHFVILGILPIGMAIRALGRKEKLAPVALVLAVIALVVGITGFTHH